MDQTINLLRCRKFKECHIMKASAQIPLNRAETWLEKPKQQYINGLWLSGNAAEWGVINPANGAELCRFVMAGSEQVEQAAQAANHCYETKGWSRVSRADKAKKLRQIASLIREHAEELAVLETLANGKLYAESSSDDIPTCADIFDYYAGWTDKFYGETAPVDEGYLSYTLKEPVGVCGLIAPWNFPLYQASLKIAPALAMGNPVVIKPSEYTPLTAIYLVELIDRYLDFPAGAINLLLTDGAMANQMTMSNRIHKISFTGSTGVGRKIVENSGLSNLKSATLELGGKSPCIFFDDTPDLQAAVDRAFTVMFHTKVKNVPNQPALSSTIRSTTKSLVV